jgi:hypothetical protein
MKIEKSLNCTIDEEETHKDITLTFKFGNFNVILNSSGLSKVDWSKFITEENHTEIEELTDSYGSHCDNGYIRFSKDNGKLFIDSDSATGFAIRFNIPFEEVKSEFESLVEWYNKTLI